MCHFVTLIAPTDDVDAVRTIMERYDRGASPVDNPSVRMALREGERQYLTTRGHCDCGTVLASRRDAPESFEDKLAREVARMRRKGWSEAKIARAAEDRRKADARPRSGGRDSFELWEAALHDLGGELRLPYAGLLVRFYSGAVATEVFNASRREAQRNVLLHDALRSLNPDEMTVFMLG